MESRPPCKKWNVAPIPSGKDLFCIPQWRRLPSPRLCFLTQPLLLGTGLGVRGSPSGRVGGNALAGHEEGGDSKRGLFLPLPPPPLASTEQDLGEGMPTIPLASQENACHNFSSFPR